MAGISRRDFMKLSGSATGGLFGFSSGLKLKWLEEVTAAETAGEKIIPTMCHGCSFGGYNCGILAHVKNGVLEKIEGNPHSPFNKGRVCVKGQSAVQWVYSQQRLKYPLKRIGEKGEGKFKRITWDEALDTIADKIKDVQENFGPEYILLAKGQASGWYNLYHKVWLRFLHSLGSPNFSWWGPFVCFVPPLFYHLVTLGGNPTSSYSKPDYDNADLIIDWFTSGGKGGVARGGVETLNTNLRSIPVKVLKRLENGAKLIVINPQMIPLAANGRAHKWIPIKPGTDAAMMLAMINVIINEKLYDKEFVAKWCHGFDKLKDHVQKYTPEWAQNISDIPAKDILDLARLYATTKRACMRFSESPEKANLQPLAVSYAILIAITGHLDRPGGNIYSYPTATLALDTLDDRISEKMLKKTLGSDTFWINVMGGPGEAGAEFITVINSLLTGKPYKLKVGLFFGTNPLSTGRDPVRLVEALKQFELCVVSDVVPTPTTRYADIVLPAATRYESPGDAAIWENHLSVSNQVVKPLWETKPDLQMILDLACKLGMEKDFWNGSYDAMLNDFLATTLKPSGKTITIDQLREKALKGVFLPRTDWMEQRERYEKHFSHLPDKKVQLYNEIFAQHGYEPLPIYRGEPEDPMNSPKLLNQYPLIFTDEHTAYLNHHSWMRQIAWLREYRKNNYIKINPDTASKYKIKEGDWVEVTSPHGAMKAVAWLFPGIRPDTIMGQHGNWQGCDDLSLPETSALNGGTNPNALYSWDQRDPITENQTKNTLVRVNKSTPPTAVQPISVKGA